MSLTLIYLQCPEDYIHRIGRTARAGAKGEAVNFVTPSDGYLWKRIHRLLNPSAKQNDKHESPRRKPRNKSDFSMGPKRFDRGTKKSAFQPKSKPKKRVFKKRVSSLA